MASNNGSLFNDSGQFSNGSSYSSQIAQYRQSGDLCAYLGIEKHSKQDDNHLGDKLDALEAVGIDLASFQAAGLWGLLFPTVVRQLRIAECSFVHYLAMIQVRALHRCVWNMLSPIIRIYMGKYFSTSSDHFLLQLHVDLLLKIRLCFPDLALDCVARNRSNFVAPIQSQFDHCDHSESVCLVWIGK